MEYRDIKDAATVNTNNILDEVISGLQPEDVPAIYIITVTIIYLNGSKRIIRGKELTEFLRDPDRENIAESRFVLDVRKIRAAIMADVNDFFDDLNQRVLAFNDNDDQFGENDID